MTATGEPEGETSTLGGFLWRFSSSLEIIIVLIVVVVVVAVFVFGGIVGRARTFSRVRKYLWVRNNSDAQDSAADRGRRTISCGRQEREITDKS